MPEHAAALDRSGLAARAQRIEGPGPEPAGVPDEVIRALGLDPARQRRRRFGWVALGALLLAGAVAAWSAPREVPDPAAQWVTEPAALGDLTVVVRATGSLQPVETVSVGAEVSGRLETVEVEANDVVTRGQVLARLETDTFENALAQAEASLIVAEAAVARAEATLTLERAELTQAESLGGTGVVTQTEQAAARAQYQQAEADLASAHAQLTLAKTKVDLSRTNLSKAEIRSPIDGVVLTRTVQPGNTIAASFQTPELFTLAAALSHMELSVSVDEADVGKVEDGQEATFTVDAWPGEAFAAEVHRVHLAATVSDNVVTYDTVLAVDNADGKLRPGMTGSATVITGRRDGALLIPNAALRFSPPAEASGGGFRLGPPRRAEPKRATGGAVWVLQAGEPVRVPVTTGATDGEWTEVLAGLAAGDAVLTGTRQAGSP